MHIRNHDLVTNLEIVYREHIAAFVTRLEIRFCWIDCENLGLACCVYHLRSTAIVVKRAEVILEERKLNIRRTFWG